jgi:hypothetical protein
MTDWDKKLHLLKASKSIPPDIQTALESLEPLPQFDPELIGWATKVFDMAKKTTQLTEDEIALCIRVVAEAKHYSRRQIQNALHANGYYVYPSNKNE